MLYEVKSGNLSPEDMLSKVQIKPFEDLGYANIDYHRGVRQGVPEIIYGRSKTPEQIAGIVENMDKAGSKDILITGMKPEAAELLEKDYLFEYHKLPKIGIVNRIENKSKSGLIVIASGGTSDMPVCEEAAITAELFGNNVVRMYDVGVAGLHRLLSKLDILTKARVVIAAAGMEGALASVIGGLVSCPVIAVPTSVGYGASFGGVAALLSMLNSCASGVSVVNIDNGFGAGYLAGMINHMEGVK